MHLREQKYKYIARRSGYVRYLIIYNVFFVNREKVLYKVYKRLTLFLIKIVLTREQRQGPSQSVQNYSIIRIIFNGKKKKLQF